MPNSRSWWPLRIAIVLTLPCACDAFEPPPGTYRFEAPEAYQAEWDSVEACSGLRGDMRRVQWYAVPDARRFPCAGGQECSGLWRSPHSVYLTEFAMAGVFNNYLTVRHEMLHDLLGGGEDHPPVFEQCGLMRQY